MRSSSARRRAIVVVTEGVAPALLDEWCGAGLLPAFSRLFCDGVRGALRAEAVPYEPPGLVSAFTGMPAADHGWFSYWSVHEPTYVPRVLTSEMHRHPYVWQRPELGHLRFGVINVFGTHPPQPLNGWTITYPTRQAVNCAFPRGVLASLARRRELPIHDVSVWFEGQPREAFVPKVLRADERRGEVALTFLDWGADVVVVNLTAVDRLSHVYWHELGTGSPSPDPPSPVLLAYQACDRVLSRLLDHVDDGTSLLAFSEVGFGPLCGYCSVNDSLAEAGFLARNPDGSPDWSRTRAFEAVQGTHGVNLNVVGRYRDGSVAPQDYAAVRQEVAEALASIVNPATASPLFARVREREDVYRGGRVTDAPDLVVEPADDRYLPLGDPHWSLHVHRPLQTGWHRAESYWAGVGGCFDGRSEGVAAPADVAATVFAMVSADLPTHLRGQPLGTR